MTVSMHGVGGGWLLADGGGDGGDGNVGVTLTPGLILTLVIIALVLLLVIGLAGWLTWRRIRRSGKAARLVEQGLLQARARTLPAGPHREVAQMRLGLVQSLAQTERVLRNAPGPSGLTDLAARVGRAAAGAQTRLQLLEREPDAALLARRLPQVRQEVEAVSADAARIRETALQFNAALDAPEQESLDADLRLEIESLEGGIATLRALG